MVSLRKNDEEQKMQRIRMDVRTAFLRHQEALQRVEALQLSVRQAQYYAEPLSESVGYSD